MRLFACVRSFHESADLFLTFSILAAGSKSFVDVARVFSTVIVPSPFARLNHFSRRGRQESVYAMAALACHSVSVRASAPASVRGARGVVKATRLPVSRAPRVVASRTRRGDAAVTCAAAELAQVALSEETITIIVAAVVGLGAGLGIPIFFVMQEERDKERLEEIRELNRATLKATGEQMSESEIDELRPNRYLDRREFKDDD